MFTGLIEAVCKVKAAKKTAAAMTLSIDLDCIAKEAKIGDSLAINGVCLTVSATAGSVASFDVSGETLARSTLGKLSAGSPVNIERAMAAQSRFGGHFVLGHIDGKARLTTVRKNGDFFEVVFNAPKELLEEMVVKGSVAIDGISLTIASISGSGFAVAIIPHTWENTTLSALKPGREVNIETDVIIKAVKKQLRLMLGQEGLTMNKLQDMGF